MNLRQDYVLLEEMQGTWRTASRERMAMTPESLLAVGGCQES